MVTENVLLNSGKIQRDLLCLRIDIKNYRNKDGAIEVVTNDALVSEPAWFKDEQGIGKVVQGNNINTCIKIKAIGDGVLKICFPVWVDYKSIKIDGKEILDAPVATWHNRPFCYEMPVKDGQEILLEAEQQYHQYTKAEIKDVLLKLYCDDIIQKLEKNLNIIDKRNYFNPDKEFFIIDSNNLDTVKEKLYGYVIQDNGIIEEANIEYLDKNNMSGCGAYVYISRQQDDIIIKQDFNGSYGLFLFQSGDYFALSNSLFYLVDYLKDKFKFELNIDYFNYMLAMEMCSEVFYDTMIKNIHLMDKDAVIEINLKNKSLSTKLIDYQLAQYSIDSAQGIQILDNWFARWTTIFRNLKEKTNNICVDLSGGIDSRISFLLTLKSGIDLNYIRVCSIEDTLHNHTEDFEIATQISKYFGFQLNKKLEADSINFSHEDAVNMYIFYFSLLQHY